LNREAALTLTTISQPFQDIKSKKSTSIINIIKNQVNKPIEDILVVGCGTGHEAGILARGFEANTTGIDIGEEFAFDHSGSAPAKLMIMDARELSFPENSFDLVYSFHSLEHIPGPKKALEEMARVLRPGGTYLIGTPNKNRLIGYIGSADTFQDKIFYNYSDLKKRLKGQWSNEAGAHAGFTQNELINLCQTAFGGSVLSITDKYYVELYGKLASWFRPAWLSSIVYPCVYVMGTKV
jgi:SAM-dependent methyltransferase